VFVAQHSGGAVAQLGSLPLSSRLANAVVAYVGYLEMSVLPANLSVFYPHPGSSLGSLQVAVCAGVLLALTLLALRCFRRIPAVTVGWLWFLGMLVPTLGVVQVGSQAMADRYTYLPLAGLALALAWGVTAAASRILGDSRWKGPLLASAGLAAVAALAVSAASQLKHWRDTETLMHHALAVTRDNHIAHAYLGVALLQRGDVDGTIAQWRESARIRPDYLSVANNLAWLLATTAETHQRSPDEAVLLAERARDLAGDDPAVLDTLAAAYASAGRFREAETTGVRALALAEASGNRAQATEVGGRLALYRRGVPYVDR
jgi:hypothetical protein